AIVDWLANGADRLGEILDRMPRRDIASFEMNLGGAVIVAGDEAMEDLRGKKAVPDSKPAHNAEIDCDQPALVIDEQISWMHVGVKEAVAQRVAQESLNKRTCQLRQVKALGLQLRPVRQRGRIDPLQRQHFLAGVVPVDFRDAKVGI